jgi:hypothetical protein
MGGVARAGSEAQRARRVAGASLSVVVLGSLLIVLVAADRPSFLAAISHAHYFPGWMAGPLGGVWPGLTRDVDALRAIFTGAVIAMYGAYVLVLRHAARTPAGWAIGAVVAAHAIFFLAPPLALTDVFNYINYARMEVVHHLNPYTTIPALEPHSDPSFALSNWHNLLSPYGPLFTMMTFALVPLGVAGGMWALKGLLLAASLGTVLLTWKCARLLDRDPVRAIVFVGLNPIVLVWGLGGDHNDFVMVFFVVLGLYLLLRARVSERAGALAMGAGAAFAGAVAVKASAAILLPIVLAALAHTPRRLAQTLGGVVLAGALLAACSLAAFGAHLPDLGTQSLMVSQLSLPNLLGLALGAGGESELLRALLTGVLGLAVLGCTALAWRRREAITPAGWATLGWVLPWYVLWVLPLAALSESRALRRASLVLGLYLILTWVPLTGVLFRQIGFYPAKTPLGQLHQRYTRGFLY